MLPRSRAPNGGSRTEDWDVAVTQLDGRVGAIEQSLTSIIGELRSLGSKLEDRGKIPWPALGVMLAFLSTIGALVYYPMQQNLSRLESGITHLSEMAVSKDDFTTIISANKDRRDDSMRETEVRIGRIERDVDKVQGDMVSRADLETRLGTSSARRDDWQRQSELKSEANRGAIERLQDAIVPRGENAEHWHEIETQLSDKQRQIDDLHKQADALYGPRDELTRLSKDVSDLQMKILKAP